MAQPAHPGGHQGVPGLLQHQLGRPLLPPGRCPSPARGQPHSSVFPETMTPPSPIKPFPTPIVFLLFKLKSARCSCHCWQFFMTAPAPVTCINAAVKLIFSHSLHNIMLASACTSRCVTLVLDSHFSAACICIGGEPYHKLSFRCCASLLQLSCGVSLGNHHYLDAQNKPL